MKSARRSAGRGTLAALAEERQVVDPRLKTVTGSKGGPQYVEVRVLNLLSLSAREADEMMMPFVRQQGEVAPPISEIGFRYQPDVAQEL